MRKPLNISREDFPETARTSDGMITISPKIDNFDMHYIEDVVYLKRGVQNLTLQIILPCDYTVLHPLIVYIPGSAFHRQELKASIPNISLLAAKGYAVAVLEYRGSEDASFPSVVLDAKAGIAFSKEYMKRYSVDNERVFVMGDSSGAYAALMAGLTYGVKSLEDEYSSNKDYSVKAIVDFYGPTDFTTMNDELSTQDHTVANSPEGLFIGGKAVDPTSEYVQQTIIKNYIKDGRKLPPIMMFHGNADELVPFSQSCELYEALKENGHNAVFYRVKGAHHGGREFWSDEILSMVDKFLKTKV